MNPLPENPSLAQLQEFIIELEQEKGWDKDTVLQKCIMLGEEVGELFRSIRKSHANIPYDSNSHTTNTAEELADILMLICFIANRLNINLESALRDKNVLNQKRHWQ